MALSDVKISKSNGGLGRRNPSEDMISGLVTHGFAVAGKVVLGTSYQLKGLTDAQDLGLNAAYDVANSVLVYEHISEFFRLNPSGELWIMLAAQAIDFASLADKDGVYAPKLLADADGKIRQLGIAFNPAPGYVPVIDDGLDQKVFEVIAEAQLLAEKQEEDHAPLSILVEGRSFTGSAVATMDLRTLAAPNVSVVIGSDATISATYPAYAALGTLLGTVSKAKVNENVGWVQKFNLTDVSRGKFVKVAFSGGAAFNSLSTANHEMLNDKGYIFIRNFPGYSGAYFNDSHTAEVLTSDFCTIENNRTIDKAHREIRIALLPKVNGPVLVDDVTGKIRPDVAKNFEGIGQSALDEMVRNEEVSATDVYVDENQNVLTTSELAIEFELTPSGTARKIKSNIKFKNPFN